MTTHTIWDMQAKEGDPDVMDKPLHRGQKVRITRTVTYVYEVSISDVMDEWDEPGVLGISALTVKEFVKDEEDNNEDFRSEADEEDDTIITVEVL